MCTGFSQHGSGPEETAKVLGYDCVPTQCPAADESRARAPRNVDYTTMPCVTPIQRNARRK